MKLEVHVGFVLFNKVIYSLDKSIKQKSITETKSHEKKFTKHRKDKRVTFGENTTYFPHHSAQFLIISTLIQGGGSVLIWIR